MRKLYSTGAMLLALGLGAVAQNQDVNTLVMPKGYPVTSMPELPRSSETQRGSIIGMYIDYDFSEAKTLGEQGGPGQPGYSSPRIAWDFNTNYTWPTDDTLTYKYAIVDFDTIHDANADIGYDYDNVVSVFVDSVFFIIGHTNISGQNDTIVMKMVALTGSGHPTNTVLWSDTLITATSLSTGSYLSPVVLTGTPGIAVDAPSKFGLRLEYYAPEMDTAAFVAGFYDGGPCPSGNTRSASESLFYPNSYYWLNGRSVPTPLPSQLWPAANGDHLITDCSGNGQYEEGSNEEWFIQNILFSVYAHVELDYWAIGIDDVDAAFDMSLYPNPVSDVLHLTLASEEANDYTITITNIEGEIVRTESTSGSSRLSQDVNLAELSNGLYIVRVNDGASIISKPFVVSH